MILIGAGLLALQFLLYIPVALILCSFFGVWAIKCTPPLAAKMLGLRPATPYQAISSAWCRCVF